MVDWLDADFSERSDSSDEEFVFHEEDVVEDTSGSSEEEESDVDRSTAANQNTPQHTYGYHINGNSAATYNNNRYASPIQNGHGLDESGYTNGKVRHHPHSYNPYGRISPRRSNGERVDDDELVHDRNGFFFPYSEQLPNRPFRKLGVPFEIFSDTFNQFHDEQETMLKELGETEREMHQMNSQLEDEIEIVKEDCNVLKNEYRDICDENKQIKEYIEEMHSFLIPYLNNIVTPDDNDEENEKGVKDMDIDKNNPDEDNEEREEDVDFEFDEVTLGPFLIELFRQQQQQQQQQQEEQGDEQEQDQQQEEKQDDDETHQERQGEQENQQDQQRQ
ncbi:hypothetical protein RclHR1_01340003 [Rhizophagus clarus]|uniref:Uncharacterized protein n=1 Tax=Rhizophagus clarus TaxID=94130 RepID=A0A2Z6R2E8_9GLOM|nr:hypothetical protein RclHR1_01340003 [Rhizophagus clarus]GES77546.1 hypothetical protein GLOIN_2v1565363 [Rhizophagus clarus]